MYDDNHAERPTPQNPSGAYTPEPPKTEWADLYELEHTIKRAFPAKTQDERVDLLARYVQTVRYNRNSGPKAGITIPDAAWDVQNDHEGNPETLTTWITINGTDMHLLAYRVREGEIDEEGAYQDDALENFARGAEPDAPFTTTPILGENFVLVATPFPE